MKRLISIAACLSISCGDTPPMRPSPTPPPVQLASTLAGSVTEPFPTTQAKISGAVVVFADGSNAGRSTETDAAGNFSFSDLHNGGFTISVSAAGYESGSFPVTIAAGQTLQTFRLFPTPRIVEDALAGTIRSNDPPCFDVGDPCQLYTFAIHRTDGIDAILTWSAQDNASLILQWYDVAAARVLAEARDLNASRQHLTIDTMAPGLYQLRVVALRANTPVPFSVHASHAN